MMEEVIRYLRKAEHALDVAEDFLKDGHIPDAASKSYYAMYYAAQALLTAEGIDVVKHSAVEAAFGYHFAKTGKIDAKFHRMLISYSHLSHSRLRVEICEGSAANFIIVQPADNFL